MKNPVSVSWSATNGIQLSGQGLVHDYSNSYESKKLTPAQAVDLALTLIKAAQQSGGVDIRGRKIRGGK